MIVKLIFESGISTQNKVIDISGRGVGMDAAKQFIENKGSNIFLRLWDEIIEASFTPFVTQITLPSTLLITR